MDRNQWAELEPDVAKFAGLSQLLQFVIVLTSISEDANLELPR